MQIWQKNRNYRRIKDKNGEIIVNIITIDGKDIEVPEEVFLAYSQADRRERYIAEEVEPGKVVSLDKLLEDHVPLEKLGVMPECSAEEYVLELEAQALMETRKIILPAIMNRLREQDRRLIQALFFDGVSTRAYARHMGISQRAVIKRRDRVLREMKKLFENFSV